VYWPEPHLVLDPDPEAGPVLVTTIYTIAPEKEQAEALSDPPSQTTHLLAAEVPD
jgi:hypothetical protein